MEDIIIRNIKEEDIPSVVDIQISGWKTVYKGGFYGFFRIS